MSSDDDPEFSDLDDDLEEFVNPKQNGGKSTKKKLSVERIYQKKTQLEHILLRPDTYIGSVERETKVSETKLTHFF